MKLFYDIMFLKEIKQTIKTNSLNANWLYSLLTEGARFLECLQKYSELIKEHLSVQEFEAFLIKAIENGKLDDVPSDIFYLHNAPLRSLVLFLLRFKTDSEVIELLSKNNYILFKIYGINLFDFVDIFKTSNPELRTFTEELIVRNKEKYLSSFAPKLGKMKTTLGNQEKIMLLQKIVEEVILHENLSWLDITNLNYKGNYSNIIAVGSKIIKVGKRVCYDIPVDERIMTPIIRLNFDDEGVIEVVEKAVVLEKISQEELYLFYRELRLRGIVWSDAKAENIGVLIKANVQHWDQEKGLITSLIGREANSSLKALDSLEWVVIDLDHLYYEDNPDISWRQDSLAFEKRYQKELINSTKTMALQEL
jgi:hypothetical protein